MQQPVYARRSRPAGYCRAGFFLLSTLVTTAVWAKAQSASPARVDIDNFGQINANYYRGGQPDAAGFAELKHLGIKTVIDLQEDGNPRESGWVRGCGMRYLNIPLSSKRPATREQTDYFLGLVNDPRNLPVFVHCAGGRHRTGEMTAIYRITHDGWTADQAFQEMERYDFYSTWGHGSLKDYVFQYYSQLATPHPSVAQKK